MSHENGSENGTTPLRTYTRARRWYPAFLTAFANSGNVRAACHAAQINRRTAYAAREVDPVFAKQWDEAREDAIDALEATAWSRARGGQSDYLLWKLLQANRRQLYGDQTKVTVEDYRAQAEKLAAEFDLDPEKVLADAERLFKSRGR